MEKKMNAELNKSFTGIRFPMIMGGVLLIFFSFSMLYADSYYPPRVSCIEGGVSYESAGDVDWTTAAVNLPLFTGDRLFAKPESRTEIEFGYNSFLRLDGNTDVIFTHLSEKAVGLTLNLGSIIVRSGKSFRMDVETRVGLVKLDNQGLYRIDTDESGLTRIMVRKGKAEIVSGSENLKIEDGQMTTIGGDPSLHRAAFESFEDDFDLWSGRRDALYSSSKSIEYVGSYYPGVYTLDDYGYWRTYPDLGMVWVPRVGAGWIPYRSGLWLDFSIGWTWLSYEPWGWLPYHYGYWYYYEPYNHWVWSPGFYAGYTSFGPWSPNCVNFYYGGGYIGWSPRVWGHGSRPNTVINNTTVVINNNNYSGRGMTVVKATDFANRRVEAAMVTNVSSTVRSGFKAGLPEGISRSTRTAMATSRAAATRTAGTPVARTGSTAPGTSDPTGSRSASLKSTRGSSESSPGSGNRISTRSETAARERSISSGVVSSIPSRGSGSSGNVTRSRTATSIGASTRERTTSSWDASSGNAGRNTARLSSSPVEPIPSSRTRSGSLDTSRGSSWGSRDAASESRVRSLTGTDVTPKITTSNIGSRTAAKTFTKDRSSSSNSGFWNRIWGGSSSSRSSSASTRVYTTPKSSGNSGGVSRPSPSSRPSSGSVSRPSSRPSSGSYSRPSSRPNSGSSSSFAPRSSSSSSSRPSPSSVSRPSSSSSSRPSSGSVSRPSSSSNSRPSSGSVSRPSSSSNSRPSSGSTSRPSSSSSRPRRPN